MSVACLSVGWRQWKWIGSTPTSRSGLDVSESDWVEYPYEAPLRRRRRLTRDARNYSFCEFGGHSPVPVPCRRLPTASPALSATMLTKSCFRPRVLLHQTLILPPILYSRFSGSSSVSSASSFSMKNVTRKNFDWVFTALRETVRDANFVALDLEMTGVVSAPWRELLEFDSSDVRYVKVKDSAEKFAVVQFGVCPFKWDDSQQTFVTQPYSAFCSVKWAYNQNSGISYLSRTQEAEVLQRLQVTGDYLSQGCSKGAGVPLVRTSDIFFTERMNHRFREWCESLVGSHIRSELFGETSGDSQMQTIFFKMRPSLLLTGFTSHQLRLIQQVIATNFRDLLYVYPYTESFEGKGMVIFTSSEEEKAALMKEIRTDLVKQMESKVAVAVGFRHVIDLLTAEKKLIVGHNCLLDFAHVHNKFIGPLPPTLEDFASAIHDNFPYIIDTKHLLRAESALMRFSKNSTSLSSAFEFLCPHIAVKSDAPSASVGFGVKVEVQTDETRSASSNAGAKHEAGYDAFMTGCIFAQACKHLNLDYKCHYGKALFEDQKLQKHLNLLYLGLDRKTMICLSDGKVLKSSCANHRQRYPDVVFSNIVLVLGFQKGTKPNEIKDSISKVFGPGAITSVFFVDESAAIVQFSKEQFVFDFLSLKDNLETSGDLLSVLNPLSKLLEGGKTKAARYDVYKEIIRSPASKVLFADQAHTLGFAWKTKVKAEDVMEDETPKGCIEETGGFGSISFKEITSFDDGFVDGSDSCVSGEQVLEALLSSKSILGKKLKT